MPGKQHLGEAIVKARAGSWNEAHAIVQQDERGELACWLHAVLHRQEGDLQNASYWYARCGHHLRKDLSIEDELKEIDEVLTRRRD